MSEDASLDAFASTDAADGDDAEESTTAESAVDATESDDSDPAVSTYEWSPAGGECADCGASVDRRWRADGEREGSLVCADCKEW